MLERLKNMTLHFKMKNKAKSGDKIFKPKEIVSIGDISKIEIPNHLPYSEALIKIRDEATGIGVTIDVSRFYSREPIELHNFASKIVYRFFEANGIKAIAYYIEDRDLYDCYYKEIDYHGKLLASCSESTVKKADKSDKEEEVILRAYKNLGIFRGFIEGAG